MSSGPGCSSCGGNNSSYDYDPANNNLLSKTENGITTQYGNYDAKGQYGYQDARRWARPRNAAPTTLMIAPVLQQDQLASPSPRSTRRAARSPATPTMPSATAPARRSAVLRRTGRAVLRRSPAPPAWQYNGPLHQLSFVDGPRSDVSDFTTYRYYPNDTSQPVGTRARLKEIEDANGVLIRVRHPLQRHRQGAYPSSVPMA